MTDLRTAAQQALEAMEYADACLKKQLTTKTKHEYAQDWLLEAGTALRAALAEPQSTHSADCYKWHHECAIARIEETEELREALKAALAEPEQIPPEAQTEAEKVAYCAGWWAAMQKAREVNEGAQNDSHDMRTTRPSSTRSRCTTATTPSTRCERR